MIGIPRLPGESDTDYMARAMRMNGVMPTVIWSCPSCGQKNRVDKAKVFGLAARPICGRCRAFLRGPQA